MKKNSLATYIKLIIIVVITAGILAIIKTNKPEIKQENIMPVVTTSDVAYSSANLEITGLKPISSNNQVNATINAFYDKILMEFKAYDSDPGATEQIKEIGYKYELNINYEVYVTKRTISYVFKENQYTGGAHGNMTYDVLTFNATTGHQLDFKDVFGDNHDAVAARVWAALDADKGRDSNNRIANHKDFLESRTTNAEMYSYFYLTNESIVFLFAPYELAPYAMGPITLTLPRSDFSDILNKDL